MEKSQNHIEDIKSTLSKDIKKAQSKRKRQKITVELPDDLVNELRNAAFWLSGPPHQLTMTGIIEAGLARELERIQKQHNQGQAFPKRTGQLKIGRPLST